MKRGAINMEIIVYFSFIFNSYIHLYIAKLVAENSNMMKETGLKHEICFLR